MNRKERKERQGNAKKNYLTPRRGDAEKEPREMDRKVCVGVEKLVPDSI